MNKQNLKKQKKTDQKIELLSPAGEWDSLLADINFGADAIYLAYKDFGMRNQAINFSLEEIKKAVDLSHQNNIKLYLALNTLLPSETVAQLPKFFEEIQDSNIDALIISDLGLIDSVKEYLPQTKIHISTQMGVVNYQTANKLFELGADRVILARELSLEDIKLIKQNIPADKEIEVFVHGSMCSAFSGRCYLAKDFNDRIANQGDCSQPCRWHYNLYLEEHQRPGKYIPIEVSESGSTILSAKDLNMLEYIPELIEAGVDSIKIEGRGKSSFYAGTITNAYRRVIDSYYETKDLSEWDLPQWVINEPTKTSHREFSTGFFFPKNSGQGFGSSNSETVHLQTKQDYLHEVQTIGKIFDIQNDPNNNTGNTSDFAKKFAKKFVCKVEIRNKLSQNQSYEVLLPNSIPFEIKVAQILDENSQEVEVADFPKKIYQVQFSILGNDDLLRETLNSITSTFPNSKMQKASNEELPFGIVRTIPKAIPEAISEAISANRY